MNSNLTGVLLTDGGGHKLINIYKKILIISDKFPKTSAYKRNVDAIICHRLRIAEESRFNRYEIEHKICCGSIGSLVLQAENEFNLIQRMIFWKPWEPLIEKPPPEQWTWPPS